MSRPVPTPRWVVLVGLGLLPALFAGASEGFFGLALGLDLALLGLAGLDFLLAPHASALEVRRLVEPVLSSGVSHPVWLELFRTAGGSGSLRGELRDEPPVEFEAKGHRQPFAMGAQVLRLTYGAVPLRRGSARFGDLTIRLQGPLGLCARQERVALSQQVSVLPDLSALSQDAFRLALSSEAPSERARRRAAEGREFDALREYRPGDDFRHLDWKATARRGKALVRTFRPERNQAVMLLLDCGRHMAGEAGGRRKIDLAVDAALRVATVALSQGDLVGACAFGTQVLAHHPPGKGPEQLRALTSLLCAVDADLEESDYGLALDQVFARHHRRTLLLVFTDLQDPVGAQALMGRLARLTPRHLPVVASLVDEDLDRAARLIPASTEEAYLRQTAVRVELDGRRTVAKLRNAGARVVRTPAAGFNAAAVNEYLKVKSRGLL